MQMIWWHNVEVKIRNWAIDTWNATIIDNDKAHTIIMRSLLALVALPYFLIVWPLKLIESVMYFFRWEIGNRIPVAGIFITLPLDMIYLFFHAAIFILIARFFGFW